MEDKKFKDDHDAGEEDGSGSGSSDGSDGENDRYSCHCLSPYIGNDCDHLMTIRRPLEHGFQTRNLQQRALDDKIPAAIEPDWHTFCEEGWKGDACTIRVCPFGSVNKKAEPTECCGNGMCKGGKCHCTLAFLGDNCCEAMPSTELLASIQGLRGGDLVATQI